MFQIRKRRLTQVIEPQNGGGQIRFPVARVPRDGKSTSTVEVSLKLVIGLGDAGGSAITIISLMRIWLLAQPSRWPRRTTGHFPLITRELLAGPV